MRTVLRRVSGILCVGAFGALALDYSPWGWTLGCAIALLLSWLMLRSIARPEPASPRETLSRVMMTGVAVLLFAILLEGGARVLSLWDPLPERMFQLHPGRIFELAPNRTSEFRLQIGVNEVRSIPVHTSPQGLRDRTFGPKGDDDYRIAILGDSFAMGFGLTQEETIGRILEGLLQRGTSNRRITVMNGGVAGYAPWQEASFLVDRCLPLNPDLVLLQLFPPNDVAGSIEQSGNALHAYNEEWMNWLRTRMRLHGWRGELEFGLYHYSQAYRRISRAFPFVKEAFIGLLQHVRVAPPPELPPLPPNNARPFHLEPCLAEPYPKLEEAWRRFESDVLEIRDLCRARDLPLVAFIVPEMSAVIDSVWEANLRAAGPNHPYVRAKDTERTESFLERERIPFVPLLAAFRAIPDSQSLYFEFDGHLTPKGAALVADRLSETIVSVIEETTSRPKG